MSAVADPVWTETWVVIVTVLGGVCWGVIIGLHYGISTGIHIERRDVKCDRPLCPRWANFTTTLTEDLPGGGTRSTITYRRCSRHDRQEDMAA